MTGCQPYCDNVRGRCPPTCTPADTSRREQLLTSASPVPPLLTSLSFSTTLGDLPHLSPPSDLRPLVLNAVMASSTEHTSNIEGNNASSHAEIQDNEARCTTVESHPASRVNTSRRQQQQKRTSSSEAVKILVTKEKEDLISYSVHELSRVQSSPAPLPSLLPKPLLPRLPSLTSSALHAQVHQSLSSPHLASSAAQRALSASPPTMIKSDKLKKAMHTPFQGELLHKPSYIVAHKRADQIRDQGDSIEEGTSEMDGITQMTAETDMSGINHKDKNKMSISRSLSRKLSEKFRKDKSPDMTTNKRRTNTLKDVRTYMGSRSSPRMNGNSSIGYLDIARDEDQSEIARGRERREKEIGMENRDRRMFPNMRRLFGGRSKSREKNEIQSEHKPPSLPTLPKHCTNDRYTAVYSPRDRQNIESSSLPYSHKSSRLQFAKSTSLLGRPSTAKILTRSSSSDAHLASTPRNRSRSVGSLITMFKEAPPMPSPLPDLRRYTNDETDPRSRWKDKYTIGTRSPHTMLAGAEEGSFILHHNDMGNTEGRPDSSSRPVQSVQQPEHSRTNPFSDENLYPPVIKKKDSKFQIMEKMTFRELNSSDPSNRNRALTEREKADRWDALLKKSEAAGGTLHLRGVDDKLPSDELRFSKTLSELARDDGSADII